MNREEVCLVFASLQLAYPVRPKFEGRQLPDMFAALSERHEYDGFEYSEASAHLYKESQCDITISRDSLVIEEHSGGFDLIKRNFADIAETVQGHLSIPVFWEPRVVLRALWAVPDGEDGGDAARVIREHAVDLTDDQFALLRVEDVRGVTLSIEATDDEDTGGRHLTIEVGPYLRDTSRLHIELADWRHIQLEGASVIEQRMQQTYDYFLECAVPFVDSITP